MKILLDREEKEIEVTRIQIVLDDKEFIISLNNFDELVINKNYSEKDSAISVKPSTSNEIRIL